MRNAILALLVFFTASSANAAITIKDYLKYKNSPDLVLTMKEVVALHIEGMAGGFNWANSEIEALYGKQLFCPPGKLPLTADNYIRILDEQLEKWQEFIKTEGRMDRPILSFFLLEGLRKTFPCKGQQ